MRCARDKTRGDDVEIERRKGARGEKYEETGRHASKQASKQASEEDREKLAMTADVIGSEAIRRDDGCLTGARSLARQL